jgi:hypothetical protein
VAPATALVTKLTKADLELADFIGRFYNDPLGFVIAAYPWDTDKSLQVCRLAFPWDMTYRTEFGPDVWACEFLEDLGRKVRANKFDGASAVPAIREAIVSGHGIGKSAMAAWLVDWIMSTRPGSQGTVTANTAEQLASKTWAQIAKWTKLCITGHWFEITTGKGAMRMTSIETPESWFCTAQTCREENSEAFAGQHAPTATSFYIFDESSAVPDSINEVSEGGLTDGEPMKFAFGNGTRNTGWFKDAFGSQQHRWGRRHIDSRSVQITNKAMLQEWIDDYGLDSDFVKVRVRGLFPSQSIKQFISEKDVDAAYGRQLKPEQYDFAPKILTLDNSWEGDDEGVIGLRQGLRFDVLRTFAKNDNDIQVANMLAQLEDEHAADAVFIDAGYGTGVVSAGKTMQRDWMLVWFAEASSDPGCLNKRAEMWKDARDWLKSGGAIPADPVLRRDLLGPETVPRLDGKLQLEAKKDMKRRGQASPNRADALVLAFAYHVTPKMYRRVKHSGEHNPFAVLEAGAVDRKPQVHDPYASLS